MHEQDGTNVPATAPGKTIGEQRVRVDFNVSGSTKVYDIKKYAAILIDLCEEMRQPSFPPVDQAPDSPDTGITNKGFVPSEKHRLISLAQTAIEEAAMWAVKAATF